MRRKMIMMNMSTGNQKEVATPPHASLMEHLAAMHLLNTEAQVYRTVYLPAPETMNELRWALDNAPQHMWINQPSTLQPLHHLHGTNVLAIHETDQTMRIYFLSGDAVSQHAPNNTLSPGWR